MSSLVLGVDGGNTKTVALVVAADGTIRPFNRYMICRVDQGRAHT